MKILLAKFRVKENPCLTSAPYQGAPNANEYVNGYKYVYENDRYQVVADMAAGYLRIKNKNTNQYVKLDGKPGSNDETHFKIKKRSEM